MAVTDLAARGRSTGRGSEAPVVVIGAGIGGLAAALSLAARGVPVTVLERAATVGGKMRETVIDGRPMDAGPTVFTLRAVFDALFEAAGTSLEAEVALAPLPLLARHWWDGAGGADGPLDLFADMARSTDAIAAFAGAAEARRYGAFCARSRAVFAALEHSFIRNSRPGPLTLLRRVGPAGLGALWNTRPFVSLWHELGRSFGDPRLRQLFARYATYCGSSPFAAPATLMLIAHVEQAGVWSLKGGMHALARALAACIVRKGGTVTTGTPVAEIVVAQGLVAGVRLPDGAEIAARAVICNADIGALAAGLLGPGVARSVRAHPPSQRSLSAVTWSILGTARGMELDRHNVFFGPDYAEEFDAVFRRGALPRAPTTYICAHDRGAGPAPAGDERLLCLVNAPPTADGAGPGEDEIEACEARTFALLARCGLTIEADPSRRVRTTPAGFEALFPATGGALYGPASHGWMASFRRPGARTRLPGLYMAGGSVHPGAGVPMAATSGQLAALSCLEDIEAALPARSRP